MTLMVLRKGSTGEAVTRWQLFLSGQEFLDDQADGIFGDITHAATKAYQTAKGLSADGIVGSATYAQAIQDGFDAVVDDIEFPSRPNFSPLVGTAGRQATFGRFDFVHDPVPTNRERIKILGNWKENNIVKVEIPELEGIDTFGTPNPGHMQFHIKAAPQLKGLWAAWNSKDLMDLVLTFGGSFVPRFIRGSRTTLSNHAFGSAFDINTSFNPLGHTPVAVGRRGSVRELVPIAHRFGFYWGGHFRNRADGMHFEVAKILSADELQQLAREFGLD